jgi:hypothetical protein
MVKARIVANFFILFLFLILANYFPLNSFIFLIISVRINFITDRSVRIYFIIIFLLKI